MRRILSPMGGSSPLRAGCRIFLLAAGLLLGLAPSASAQLSAVGVRNLAFGSVIRGLASIVSPNDPVKSGQFEVQVALGTRLRLDYTLPTQLNGPSGATMPINFANTDCILLETAPGSVPNTQNPKSMKPYTMTYGNRLFLFLGGQVSPTGTQATGVYSASVTLTVTIM
jgi:hypothetical protein